MLWVNKQNRAPDLWILRSEALLLSKKEPYGKFHNRKNKRNSISLHLFIQIHTCCFGRRNNLLFGRLGTVAGWLYRNSFTQWWMLSISWNIFKNTKPNRQQLDSLMKFGTDMRLHVVQTTIIWITHPNLACKALCSYECGCKISKNANLREEFGTRVILPSSASKLSI